MNKFRHKIGKNWGKMEILKNKVESKDLFISQNRPSFFVNKDLYTVHTSSKEIFTDEFLEKLSNFYNTHHRIERSNDTIEMSKENFKEYMNIDAEILTIYKDKIIGSMISVLLPIKINTDLNQNISIESSDRIKSIKNDDSLLFACASFLILEKKYRGKGFGMALIQESLQILHDIGGLGAFFVNKVSRCVNSVPLYSWYFPLNLEKLDKHNFQYPRDFKYLFKLEENKNYKIVKVNESNAKESLNFYLNHVKDKKMYFLPSLNYWKKWIISFPTYVLFLNGEISGLFSFRNNIIRYPTNRMKISFAWLITCVGKQPETLKASLLISKKLFDMVKIFELGDLNSEIISSVNAQKSDKNYINFFNTQIFLKSNEIYFPIF
jgi:GNAT superfamily N-acetyltransferase